MGRGMWWLSFRGLYLIFSTVVTLLPPVPRNPHSCSSNLQRLFELYIWGLEKWPWLGLWTQGRQWESDPDRSSFITGRTHLCSNKGAQGPSYESHLISCAQWSSACLGIPGPHVCGYLCMWCGLFGERTGEVIHMYACSDTAGTSSCRSTCPSINGFHAWKLAQVQTPAPRLRFGLLLG